MALPRALLVLLAAIARPASAIIIGALDAKALALTDPTAGGEMQRFMQHQPWVTELFANPILAQEEARRYHADTFEKMQHAIEQPDDYMAQMVACSALVATAQANHSSKPYLAAAGGMNMTVATLRRLLQYSASDAPENAKPWAKACAAALSVLAMYQRDVQEEAGEAGAVELVLDVQRHWRDHADMQMGGLSGCFMDFSQKNRGRWAAAGGIAYNIETLRRYYNNSPVVLQCWYAFSCGTQSPNERPFVENGGIAEAMRAMTDHKNYSRTREEAMQAMRALSRCRGCEDLQEQLVEAGFLENIATAMREVPMDIHIQSPSCANVWSLSQNSAARRARAVEAGVAELALRAVRDFPRMVSSVDWAFNDQYTVYEDCVRALGSLVEDEHARAMLLQENASRYVREAVGRKPQSGMLQKAAKRLLEALEAPSA